MRTFMVILALILALGGIEFILNLLATVRGY